MMVGVVEVTAGVVEVTVGVVEVGMSVEVVDAIAPPTIMTLVTMMSVEVVDAIAACTIMTLVTITHQMTLIISTVQRTTMTTMIGMASKIIHFMKMEMVLQPGVMIVMLMTATAAQKRKRL
jgi:hypothetical protein